MKNNESLLAMLLNQQPKAKLVLVQEFTLSNTLDEKIKDVEKMFKHYNYLCKPENSFSLNSKVREKMVEKMKQVINVYNQIKKEN